MNNFIRKSTSSKNGLTTCKIVPHDFQVFAVDIFYFCVLTNNFLCLLSFMKCDHFVNLFFCYSCTVFKVLFLQWPVSNICFLLCFRNNVKDNSRTWEFLVDNVRAAKPRGYYLRETTR